MATAADLGEGIPTGFPQTPAGAAAAAANHLHVLLDRRQFDPAFQDQLVERVLWGELADAYRQGWEAAARGLPDPAGLATDTGYVRRVVPAGYQVENFTSEEAQVVVWFLYMQGTGTEAVDVGQPGSAWLGERVTLQWHDGDWRSAASEETDAPQPPTAVDGGSTTNAAAINAFVPFVSAAPEAQP